MSWLRGCSNMEDDEPDDVFFSIPIISDEDFVSLPEIISSSDSSLCSDVGIEDQTEDVVTNFMFRRHESTQAIDGDITDMIPRSLVDIRDFRSNHNRVTALLGRELANVGDDISKRYGHLFRNMLRHLALEQLSHEDTYEIFAQVTGKLFETGVSWGRIVALLCFSYHAATRLARNVSQFLKYVVQFILKEKIAAWIIEQGGWLMAHAFVESVSISKATFNFILVAAVTSVVVAWYFSRR